jgi:hypothetical protein
VLTDDLRLEQAFAITQVIDRLRAYGPLGQSIETVVLELELNVTQISVTANPSSRNAIETLQSCSAFVVNVIL